jgi:citrate lyase beta subunit
MYKRMVVEFEYAQDKIGTAAINFEGNMVDIAAYKRALKIIKKGGEL